MKDPTYQGRDVEVEGWAHQAWPWGQDGRDCALRGWRGRRVQARSSLREVARGLLTRFLPASVASLFGVVAVGSAGHLGPVVGILGSLTGFVGLGFAVGVLALRRWLYPDAKVAGLRSVLAGLPAPLLPLGFLSISTLLHLRLQLGRWEFAAIFALGGILAAIGMFFPWLVATPPEMRGQPGPAPEETEGKRLSGGAP